MFWGSGGKRGGLRQRGVLSITRVTTHKHVNMLLYTHTHVDAIEVSYTLDTPWLSSLMRIKMFQKTQTCPAQIILVHWRHVGNIRGCYTTEACCMIFKTLNEGCWGKRTEDDVKTLDDWWKDVLKRCFFVARIKMKLLRWRDRMYRELQ